MKDYEMISVIERYNDTVMIKSNPTNYPLIEKGWQGAVFKLSDERCVKIYARTHIASGEADAYKRIQGSTIFPKLYEVGPKYIVMEYIEGLTLEKYLKRKNYISESITKQILLLLEEIKKLDFKEIDFQLCNVIVMNDEILRLIDIANSFKIQKKHPELLYKGLNKLGLLGMFIRQVKKIDFNAYLEIKNLEMKIFGVKSMY